MRAVPRMTATSMPQGTFSRSGTSVSQEESPGFSRGEGVNTILALSPLAIGMGDGGEAQAPMARVVIGGLLSSTLITMVLIPTLYLLFHRRSQQHGHEPVYRMPVDYA